MQKALGDKRRFMTLFQSLTEESATFQVVVLPLRYARAHRTAPHTQLMLFVRRVIIRIRALTLINALINGTEDLEERFALRNEFLAMNMASALKVPCAFHHPPPTTTTTTTDAGLGLT